MVNDDEFSCGYIHVIYIHTTNSIFLCAIVGYASFPIACSTGYNQYRQQYKCNPTQKCQHIYMTCETYRKKKYSIFSHHVTMLIDEYGENVPAIRKLCAVLAASCRSSGNKSTHRSNS